MTKTYPRSLAGLFSISFTDHTLKPIRLIDTRPSDYQLKEIRFGANRIGTAIFENGVHFSFPVKWDGITDYYAFVYNEAGHVFNTKNESGEVLTHTDVMSLTDLNPYSSTEFEMT